MKTISSSSTLWLMVVASIVVAECSAAPVQLLSMRDPAVVLPAGGNGNSSEPFITPDGRFVAFTSEASDLVALDNRRFSTDVFLRDRASNTTVMVSVNVLGIGGGSSYSLLRQISTNGNFVLFESDAFDLDSGDTNGNTDIFLRDVAAGLTERISVTTNGQSGVKRSYDAVMTPDARCVAFISASGNFVADDTNNIPDVFVRDRISGTISLASVGATSPGGPVPSYVMATPRITPDGRYVAFFSSATGMVASPGPTGKGDVYVRDLLSGTTTWASTNGRDFLAAIFGPDGATNGVFRHPDISADGRYVSFTGSTNTTGRALLFLFDQVAGTTTVISTNIAGAFPGDATPFGPGMTGAGRFIVHVDLNADDTNSNVYVYDALAGTNILCSGDGLGVAVDAISRSPVITSNGRFVAFLSDASNLVTNVVSSGFHVYLHDLQAGTTKLVDTDTNNAGSVDVDGTTLSLTDDGRFVSFDSPDGQLVADDKNRVRDVFLRDSVAGTNELISQRGPIIPQPGDNITRMSPYSISADGRWMAFESLASDLVPDDTNDWSDIFVRDLWSGQTMRVSPNVNAFSNVIPFAVNPVISADGHFVAYVRAVFNGKTNGNTTSLQVFRWDRDSGTTLPVSVGTNGVGFVAGDCSDPVISSDGRYITFLSVAVSSSTGTFWRDMNTSNSVLAGAGGTLPSRFRPSMSADGRYVARQSSSQLRIRDMFLGVDIHTNSAAMTTAAISPDGGRILYGQSTNSVRVIDVISRSNLMSFSSRVPVQSPGQWSSDGRYVVFVGVTNLTTDTDKVYRCDLVTSNITLISRRAETSGTPNGRSDMPVISGNGQWIVYRSFATDIVTNTPSVAPRIFLYDSSTGTASRLLESPTDIQPYTWVSAPVLSSGGENTAFLSVNSDIAAGDRNRVADAFATRILIRTEISAPVSGSPTISWQTIPQRTYAVEYRDDLNELQWHPLSATISFTGDMGSVSVPADQFSRFYRIVESD